MDNVVNMSVIWMCLFRKAKREAIKILGGGDETAIEVNLICSLAGAVKCQNKVSRRQ